ncbi:MAG: capsid protein, partial [Clostridium sp.]|nr:capsid protein [Clostridium sp.]
TKFDAMMDKMDEKRVPAAGRILYADTPTKTLIDTAKEASRSLSSQDTSIARSLDRIGEVEIIGVPKSAMKSAYKFTDDGYEAEETAKDVKMILIHPSAVIPVIAYDFAQLGAPSSLSQGKWTYFEESFEDVFIYNKKHDAIQFYIERKA